jgi:hypothetical protein
VSAAVAGVLEFQLRAFAEAAENRDRKRSFVVDIVISAKKMNE